MAGAAANSPGQTGGASAEDEPEVLQTARKLDALLHDERMLIAEMENALRIIRDSREVDPDSDNLMSTVRQWIERLAAEADAAAVEIHGLRRLA